MIVVAIVLVIMTAGIPMMWRAMTKDPLAKAVNDVLEGCKTARDRAILQNQPFDFVIRNRDENDAEMGVEAAKTKDAAGPDSPTVVVGADKEAKHDPASFVGDFPRKLGNDVAIELLAVNFVDLMGASEARERFYQNGTADEFTVTFMRKGVRRTITVDIITGATYEVIK